MITVLLQEIIHCVTKETVSELGSSPSASSLFSHSGLRRPITGRPVRRRLLVGPL